MLVIYQRNFQQFNNNGGMRRYYHQNKAVIGDGIIDNLLQKSGIKTENLLSTAHNVIDTVVEGAATASKKVADSLIDKVSEKSTKIVNKAIDSLVDKVVVAKNEKKKIKLNNSDSQQQQQQH